MSALSLGSWHTLEHAPRDTGSAILAAAREEGINFSDDARYNDHTGKAAATSHTAVTEALAAGGMAFERLDQLALEHLYGVAVAGRERRARGIRLNP